jgi:HAD superfamily hydrolase (TIGR01490 family)
LKLHIFDVDYTIVRCSTVREFILAGLLGGVVGLSIVFYLPWLFIQYRRHGSSGRHVEQAYPFLKGAKRTALDTLAAVVFARRIRPRLDSVIVNRITAIREAGGHVIIASSSFRTILEPLASYLGISELVTSELEFRDGATTGRVAGQPAFGDGKLSRILTWLDEHGLDPADCAFYSDSHHDLPLLQAVGQPVAVNPGKKLRHVARQAGWEIVQT